MLTDDHYDPTLTLIYLPHLDYCLQKFGPDPLKIKKDLQAIDKLVEKLVTFYEKKNAKIIILSEYGIASVSKPVHLNRLLRKHGLLQVRVERGLELLDAGASKAFVVADHQVSHVYINDASVTSQVRNLLGRVPGIELVLDRVAQAKYHIDHARGGDLVLMADAESWFTYYFWMEDAKAPDYARSVDIHRKPGYDPVEMFMTSKLRAAYKLLRKKSGLRYVMDVIPLDATLIKGSHGRIGVSSEFCPVIITDQNMQRNNVSAVDVFEIIYEQIWK